MDKYPIVPGRGLNSNNARRYRLDFLKEQGIEIPALADSRLEEQQIQHNIESYIGSVEIPIGLAGPLLFNDRKGSEYVYAPAGTLEGALVASMNRGAKVVSNSGGFNAEVIHQKMIRSPMFLFRNLEECVRFKAWVEMRFVQIKEIAEQYSNHARLQGLSATIAGRSVHLKFVYTTGDASGQNMTTTCTAHAINWISEKLKLEPDIDPVHYVIEGNSASDKKVSHVSINQGRGIHVIAECELKEHEINRILRVSSEEIWSLFNQTQTISRMDGMIGFNINVANTIAAIFVATGQDLASIHESGTGILNMEKTADGLYCTLHLPNLVIGTVGGGTQVLRQREALGMMGCAGGGKVTRFAKLIAGFALSLEISTTGAIAGGQFAKVHEKLGRNKPVDWLLKAQMDQEFLKKNLNNSNGQHLHSVHFLKKELVDNGLIINLTSRINNKLTGFVPMELWFNNTPDSVPTREAVLVKSKPLDTEVIQGLRYMAASIDPALADLIMANQQVLEYKDCHLKEAYLYKMLAENGLNVTPKFWGNYAQPAREIYTLVVELLKESELKFYNTENKPQAWDAAHIKSVIRTITDIHIALSNLDKDKIPAELKPFEPWKAKPLYTKFAEIMQLEYEDEQWHDLPQRLLGFIDEMESLHQKIKVPKTIVHNDFNTRNIAIRQGGEVCIYDWELAMYNFPHRDVVEFLSFAMPLDFEEQAMLEYMKYHYSLNNTKLSWEDWKAAYIYSLKEYLATRVSFYMTGKILMNYLFADRIFQNSFRMIDILTASKL